MDSLPFPPLRAQRPQRTKEPLPHQLWLALGGGPDRPCSLPGHAGEKHADLPFQAEGTPLPVRSLSHVVSVSGYSLCRCDVKTLGKCDSITSPHIGRVSTGQWVFCGRQRTGQHPCHGVCLESRALTVQTRPELSSWPLPQSGRLFSFAPSQQVPGDLLSHAGAGVLLKGPLCRPDTSTPVLCVGQ